MKNQKNITCLNSISGYTKSYFILNKTFINPVLFFKNDDSALFPLKQKIRNYSKQNLTI